MQRSGKCENYQRFISHQCQQEALSINGSLLENYMLQKKVNLPRLYSLVENGHHAFHNILVESHTAIDIQLQEKGEEKLNYKIVQVLISSQYS